MYRVAYGCTQIKLSPKLYSTCALLEYSYAGPLLSKQARRSHDAAKSEEGVSVLEIMRTPALLWKSYQLGQHRISCQWSIYN
eukprot:SAG31_NODE_1085_length_10006_cov_34.511154_4_plen_82_part_00